MKTKFTITVDPDLAHKIRGAIAQLSYNPACSESERFHISQIVQSIWGETTFTFEGETPRPENQEKRAGL